MRQSRVTLPRRSGAQDGRLQAQDLSHATRFAARQPSGALLVEPRVPQRNLGNSKGRPHQRTRPGACGVRPLPPGEPRSEDHFSSDKGRTAGHYEFAGGEIPFFLPLVSGAQAFLGYWFILGSPGRGFGCLLVGRARHVRRGSQTLRKRP